MLYAILLAAIALAYWVARELILNTFKDFSSRKPYIICFSLVGFSLAVAFVVAGQFMHPSFGMLMPRYGLVQLFLCPSSLLGLALMDVPHPSLNSIFVLGLLMAVMNSALYAAVGGRIGEAALKSKAVRS